MGVGTKKERIWLVLPVVNCLDIHFYSIIPPTCIFMISWHSTFFSLSHVSESLPVMISHFLNRYRIRHSREPGKQNPPIFTMRAHSPSSKKISACIPYFRQTQPLSQHRLKPSDQSRRFAPQSTCPNRSGNF